MIFIISPTPTIAIIVAESPRNRRSSLRTTVARSSRPSYRGSSNINTRYIMSLGQSFVFLVCHVARSVIWYFSIHDNLCIMFLSVMVSLCILSNVGLLLCIFDRACWCLIMCHISCELWRWPSYSSFWLWYVLGITRCSVALYTTIVAVV